MAGEVERKGGEGWQEGRGGRKRETDGKRAHWYAGRLCMQTDTHTRTRTHCSE